MVKSLPLATLSNVTGLCCRIVPPPISCITRGSIGHPNIFLNFPSLFSFCAHQNSEVLTFLFSPLFLSLTIRMMFASRTRFHSKCNGGNNVRFYYEIQCFHKTDFGKRFSAYIYMGNHTYFYNSFQPVQGRRVTRDRRLYSKS